MDDMIQRHRKHLGGDNGPRECHIGLAEGKTYFDFDDEFQTTKGRGRQLHTWTAVAPGYENSLAKVYVCYVDVSALKKIENELMVYKNHLEDLVKERTEALNISQKNLTDLLLSERDLRHQLEVQIQERAILMRTIAQEPRTPLSPYAQVIISGKR
jgi:hypothetical protein